VFVTLEYSRNIGGPYTSLYRGVPECSRIGYIGSRSGYLLTAV